MIKKENLIQKVLVHDIDNWVKETKTVRYQNSWDLFKREMQDNDQVWSYSYKEGRETFQGYCILREGQIIKLFQTAKL